MSCSLTSINFIAKQRYLPGNLFFIPCPYTVLLYPWMARSADPSYSNYIDQILMKPSYAEVNDVYGGLLLKQCGYLDTVKYMDSVRKCVEQNGFYEKEELDFKALTLDDGIGYKHYRSDKIIFCHG